MLHCKIVNVYTGYAENSIQGIEIAPFADVLRTAQYTSTSFINNMINEGCTPAQATEFAGYYVVDEVHGYVNSGEENVKIVMTTKSPWYNAVDVHPDWSELQYNDWSEFIFSLELASANYHHPLPTDGMEL